MRAHAPRIDVQEREPVEANSGKTQLVVIAGRFMFGEDFAGAIRSHMTGKVLQGIEASYQRMPAFFDDVNRTHFRTHGHPWIKDETTPEQDETPCIVMSMNPKAAALPEEITKRCLLIYAQAALPGDQEDKRIEISGTLAQIHPTTHLYRAYLHDAIARTREANPDTDWLETSSTILTETLKRHGVTRVWARPIAWKDYAATRYETLREQLRSVLDPNRRRRRLGPDDLGWCVEGGRLRVRVPTDSYGRPSFNWEDLPTYMLHENQSRGGEFVLESPAVEGFLDERVQPRTWWKRRR